MNLLYNENFIKSILIDYLHTKYKNIILGSEVRFGYNGNFADLLLLRPNSITAFEIKAEKDDLRNLTVQLNYYKKVFDFITLVVTEKHFKCVQREIIPEVGLFIVKNNCEIEVLLPSKKLNSNEKKEILYSMRLDYLKNYFKIDFKDSSIDIRKILENKTICEIKKAYYNYLKNKLIDKTNLFESERGIKTHFEDIKLLSFNMKSCLFN